MEPLPLAVLTRRKLERRRGREKIRQRQDVHTSSSSSSSSSREVPSLKMSSTISAAVPGHEPYEWARRYAPKTFSELILAFNKKKAEEIRQLMRDALQRRVSTRRRALWVPWRWEIFFGQHPCERRRRASPLLAGFCSRWPNVIQLEAESPRLFAWTGNGDFYGEGCGQ